MLEKEKADTIANALLKAKTKHEVWQELKDLKDSLKGDGRFPADYKERLVEVLKRDGKPLAFAYMSAYFSKNSINLASERINRAMMTVLEEYIEEKKDLDKRLGNIKKTLYNNNY